MKTIRPSGLKPSAVIGIASPASYADPFSLKAGIDFFRAQGYQTRLGSATRKVLKTGFLSAPDGERAKELMELFEDSRVDAIFASVGGYGAGMLLPLLDYDLIRDNPKILVGYSDITFLHIAIYNKTGLVTFHGPSASHLDQSLDGDTLRIKRDNLLNTLKLLSGESNLEISNPPGGMLVRSIHGGIANGRLMGGNLDICEDTFSTPYEIQLDGCLFFFEAVDSSEYSVDKSLVHFKLAGKLDHVSGIIAGEFSEIPKPTEPGPSMEEVLHSRIAPLSKPSVLGLQCGHGKAHVTVPVGMDASLDADQPSIVLKESPVE